VDSQPETRLLAAVVSLAVRDLAHRPLLENKKPVMTVEARSACRFLFSDSSDGYLDALNYDPEAFRAQLTRMMNNTSHEKIAGFDPMDRRVMRQNYQLWRSHAGLDNDVLDDEIELEPDALTPPKKRGRFSYQPSLGNRSRRKTVR
jgi:hypothetical protein